MLNNNIIRVGNKWDDNKKLLFWELSNTKIIEKIDEMWFDDAEYPDFIEMIWFGFENWYLNALKEKGYGKERLFWIDFVEKNIGNLEQWIEENKPN